MSESAASKIQDIKRKLLKLGVEEKPEAAIVLGSGLGGFSSAIENKITIPYSDIPHFPSPSVTGHSGELIYGSVFSKPVLAFSGRFHHYEGHDFETTILPVAVTSALHAKKLIISNAAGAINRSFQVGDLMVINDIIRPFIGISPVSSDRFHYNHYETAQKIPKIAAELGIFVRTGTYLYAKGPNYETKAEIRSFRTLNADVVGMSTVPELIEAARLNLKTAAISLVTNMAAGVLKQKLSHEEVKFTAESRKEDFAKLVSALVLNL